MSSRKSGKMSARVVRYQKRRASIAIASLLKGPDTKDSPITISSSDDDKGAEGDGLTAGAAQLRTEAKPTRTVKYKKSTVGDEKSDRNPYGEDALAADPKPGSEDGGTDADGTVAGSKVAPGGEYREQAPLRGRKADAPGVPAPSSETSIRDMRPVKGEFLSTESSRKYWGSTSRRKRGHSDGRRYIPMEVGDGVEDGNGHASSGAGDCVHGRDSDPLEGAGGESIVRERRGGFGDGSSHGRNGGDEDGDAGGGGSGRNGSEKRQKRCASEVKDEIEGEAEEKNDEDDASRKVEAEGNTGIWVHQANVGHGFEASREITDYNDDLEKQYGEGGGMGKEVSIQNIGTLMTGDTRGAATDCMESNEKDIRVPQLVDGITSPAGGLSPSAEDGGERAAEFGFPSRRTDQVAAAATTPASWAKRFTFTRCIPAKRSRISRDEDTDSQAFVSDYDTEGAEDHSSGVFEFAIFRRAYGREARHRVLIMDRKEATVTVPPSMAPLESGSSSSNASSVFGPTLDLSVSPPQAPTATGFDRSLFRKPGEWKCEACLVTNPSARDACLSCETAKPAVGLRGSAAGLGASAVISRSSIFGHRVTGSSSSPNQGFSLAVQPGSASLFGGGLTSVARSDDRGRLFALSNTVRLPDPTITGDISSSTIAGVASSAGPAVSTSGVGHVSTPSPAHGPAPTDSSSSAAPGSPAAAPRDGDRQNNPWTSNPAQ